MFCLQKNDIFLIVPYIQLYLSHVYASNEYNYNKTYQLKKFVKVGQTDKTNIFSDETYTNKKNKDISITLDFSQAEITENLTFKVHLELINSNKEAVVSTLKDTIKEEDIPVIIKRADQEANPLYPVPKLLDNQDFVDILREIME